MAQVEADRRSASGARPKLIRPELLNDGKYILAHLEYRVSGRLKKRLDAGHRPAQPDFRRQRH
jgi:hypothetical protein